MKNELFVLDILSVVSGGKVPGSTEEGVRLVLETWTGAPLSRADWVSVADKVRHDLISVYPDLLDVPVPDEQAHSLIREWKKAIFHHFGPSLEVKRPSPQVQ